jgi:hypothetical protein
MYICSVVRDKIVGLVWNMGISEPVEHNFTVITEFYTEISSVFQKRRQENTLKSALLQQQNTFA